MQIFNLLPHHLTQTYPDAYIEEEGRPKSSITASLYGETNDHTGQWANRPTNGQMPLVSMQYKQINVISLILPPELRPYQPQWFYSPAALHKAI